MIEGKGGQRKKSFSLIPSFSSPWYKKEGGNYYSPAAPKNNEKERPINSTN